MKFKYSMVIVLILGFVLFSFGCENLQDSYKVIDETSMNYLDTEVEVKLYEKDKTRGEKIIGKVFQEIERLESILARHEPESDIDKINQNAGEEKVKVNPETIELLKKAKKWGEITEGHFDVTVASLMNRWGFGEEREYEKIGRTDDEGDPLVDFELPGEEEIDEIKTYVDYKRIELDEENKSAYLPSNNMEIEVAGIAKGYILGKAREVLENNGIEHGFVRAGGDIAAVGGKPDEPWVIAIRHPRGGNYFSTYHLEDRAIGTAGDYMRYYELDGERYSHIIDPLEGRPASGVVSVTVEAGSAVEIDVISTTAFIKGVEEGLDFIEDLDDVEGVLVDDEGKVHYTTGFDEGMHEGPAEGETIF